LAIFFLIRSNAWFCKHWSKSRMTNNRVAFFYSSMVRGEGNSVIFIKREILLCPEDARICFILFNENEGLRWNAKTYSIDNDCLWNSAVFFYLFYFLEISIHHGWVRSLNTLTKTIAFTTIINCRHIDRTHLDRNNRYFVTETVVIIVTAKHTK